MTKESIYNGIPLSMLHDVASTAALRAKEILHEAYRYIIPYKIKSNPHDFVTEYDKMVENEIISIIAKEFPDHSILGEEGGHQKIGSDFNWIIDPIDGTWNFVRKIPSFCTSIGLAYKEELILGIVVDPLANEWYVGKKNHGASVNSFPICVSPINSLEQAGLSLSGKHPEILQLAKETGVLRRSGATALDLCYVAKGALDALVEKSVLPWDFAAGILIIEEAGGIVTSWDKTAINPLQKESIIASNHHLYETIHKTMLINQ